MSQFLESTRCGTPRDPWMKGNQHQPGTDAAHEVFAHLAGRFPGEFPEETLATPEALFLVDGGTRIPSSTKGECGLGNMHRAPLHPH